MLEREVIHISLAPLYPGSISYHAVGMPQYLIIEKKWAIQSRYPGVLARLSGCLATSRASSPARSSLSTCAELSVTTVFDHHWLGGEARLDEGVPGWGRGGARAREFPPFPIVN